MNHIVETVTFRSDVWVEGISVYVPHYFMPHREFALTTGVDPDKYTAGLGCKNMAITHPVEDAVTMAAEAGENLFTWWGFDPDDFGLLIVATETGVDWAKPVASYIHQFLSLPSDCRAFDLQHACFGATGALSMAAGWICSGMSGGRKALVIATDIAKYEVGSAGEATQGAGAVALAVGAGAETTKRVFSPNFSLNAVYSQNVMDFWRPGYSQNAVVNGKYSIECYLKALGACYTKYRMGGGRSYRQFSYLLFHLPFPKMAWKAVLKLEEIESEISGSALADGELADFYEKRVSPSTFGARQIGNIYCGSVYLAMASLLEVEKDCAAGEEIALFSYGSGCCAEFFTAVIGGRREIWEGKIGLLKALSRRERLDYKTYLEFRKVSDGLAHSESFSVGRIPAGQHIPPELRYMFLGYKRNRRMYITSIAERDYWSDKVRSGAQSQF